VASLGADSPAVLQFNVPKIIPQNLGALKLRILGMANEALSHVAKITVKDANVAAGNSLGTSTLNSESQVTVTFATADILTETKLALTSIPNGNDILTVLVTFNTSGWTVAQPSTWQFSLIWE
jgi:hypothetical protein